MSTATLASDGLAALEKRDTSLAITKLTQALQSSVSTHLNPSWLIARSKAFNTTSNFDASLQDADLALHSALGRGDKKSIIAAHHRRAVAYNRLGELANADACCVYAMEALAGKKVQPKEDPADGFTDGEGFWTVDVEGMQEYVDGHPLGDKERAKTNDQASTRHPADAMRGPTEETKQFWLIAQLRNMVVKKLVGLGEKDEGRKRTVKLMPPKRGLYIPEGMEKTGSKASEKVETLSEGTKSTTTAAAAAAAAAPVPVSENAELNIQSYESDTVMNATIFSKGVSKENLKVHFTESTVALNPLKYPGGVEKECVISLNGAIKPSECSYRVTPSKVELKLVKAEAGKWKDVGEQGVAPPPGEGAATFTPSASASDLIGEREPQKPTSTTTPAYPTSSRSGPVNWDKVVDLEDDDAEDEKDVNDFFKKIYQGADPDAKRAMMKSFVESNGTSLSTNWAEVNKGKVETVPPEGVEAKKW